MKTKLIVTALLLCLSVPVLAQFEPIAETYEVAISNVRLPQTEGGTIAFKKCDECEFETRRVNSNTAWEFNGERMSLEKFRRALATVDRSKEIPVQVEHHFESNQITKVWIRVP